MRIDILDTRGTGTGLGTVASSSFTQNWKNPTAVSWASYLGNPTALGARITGQAIYFDTVAGVYVPQATGYVGTIAWYLTGSNAFDFRRDFRATFTTYYAGTVGNLINGDGFYYNFGGSGSSDEYYGRKDGSYSMYYETQRGTSGSYGSIDGTIVKLDGTALTPQIISAMSNTWYTTEIAVRANKMQNKRFASMTVNGSYLLGGQDVTSWNAAPSGTLTVGGRMGGATAAHYMKGVTLEYL